MRSSVAESRPPGNLETRSPVTVPGTKFRTPHPQRHAAQSVAHKPRQRTFSLAPHEGWLAMLLLTIAVYSIVFSIISANWVGNSYILLWSTAVGLLAGLCVAKIQRFPQAILHLGACLGGYWLSIWLTSMVAFHVSWLVLLENLRVVITGVFAMPAAANGELIFLFYLSFLSFFLGYFGAWLIYRAHLPWLVALVYCAIMLVNLNYVKQDFSYLVVILLGSLILLVARIQLVNQLNQWTNEGLHTDHTWLQDISRRFAWISSLFMLLILLISLVSSNLVQPGTGVNFWNNLDNAWTTITRAQLPISGQGPLFQPFQSAANFFGDQLSITGSVNLPPGEVLYYTSSATSQSQYLEGFSYDKFDGHTWTSSASNENQQFPAGAQLPVETSGNFNRVTTTITIELPPDGTKHYIFAPAQPARFSVPTVIYTNGITTAWTQQDPLKQGERYQATSSISAATAQDLTTVLFPQHGQNLWSNDSNVSVVDRYYLQTPTDLPPSVHNTAVQWTRGTTNVYDAMKKLEAHLSDPTQFTYSVNNPPVPGNVDAVAWLLQTHQGYCTYYASAMAIMARLLGVPARVVNGFSQGHYDSQRKVWVVDGKDAHSWVQVYFPGSGWVNFDPTPGFSLNGSPATQPNQAPGQNRPPIKPNPTSTSGHQKTGSQHTPAPGSISGTGTSSLDAQARQNLFLGLSLLILCASIIFFAFALFKWYNAYWLNAAATVASTMFWRVCRLGSWIGLPPKGSQTPYEYNRVLSRRFPRAAAPLRRVTDLFVRERWAAPDELPGAAEEQALQKLWPHLRNTFLRALFTRRYIRARK